MFGSHKKLYRDGAETEGVVIRARAAVNPLTVDPGYEVVVRAMIVAFMVPVPRG